MVFETEDVEDILIGIVVYCKRRKTWIGLGEVFFLSFFFLDTVCRTVCLGTECRT